MVPVFDIANHQTDSPCWHRANAALGAFELLTAVEEPRASAASGAFELLTAAEQPTQGAASTAAAAAAAASVSAVSAAAAVHAAPAGAPATALDAWREVRITYGPKSNAKLLDQYGFVTPGNPHDRLALAGCELGGSGSGNRLRRETLAAALALLQGDAPAVCGSAGRAAAQPTTACSVNGVVERGASSCANQTSKLRQPATGPVATAHQPLALPFDTGCLDTGVNWNGAHAARLQAAMASMLSAAGWRNLKEFKDISPAGEAACLAAISDFLQRQAAAWQTTPGEDSQFLAQLRQGAGAVNADIVAEASSSGAGSAAQKGAGWHGNAGSIANSPSQAAVAEGRFEVSAARFDASPVLAAGRDEISENVSNLCTAAASAARLEAAVAYRLERKRLALAGLELAQAALQLVTEAA